MKNFCKRLAPALPRVSVGLALLTSVAAQGALVVAPGDNVVFSYDDSTPYGTGTVVGDTISFTPTGIRASSNIFGEPSGFGGDQGILEIIITVLDEKEVFLDSITTTESGDFTLFGDATFVKAQLYTEVDSMTVTDPIVTSTADTGLKTTPQNGDLTEWDLSTTNSWSWSGETMIEFTIQNTLTSYAPDGQYAWIQKKNGEVGIEVQVIPLPGAIWLMLSGLMGLLVTKRIRK